MNGIFHLNGTVKNYDWGGFSFLPALLNVANREKTPYAEYWIGTHPSGPSFIHEGKEKVPLTEVTGELPYLFKLLDVNRMLSIQVHPSRQGAMEGFEEENQRGLAAGDPVRNYVDPNDKPELMVALGDFWLLHGFKPVEELHDTLMNVTALSELLPIFHSKGYRGLYDAVMTMPQREVNRILQVLRQSLPDFSEQNGQGEIPNPKSGIRNQEDYWASEAMKHFTRDGDIDRGIFSIYFFNLVHLKKGEGIFQAAGVPHAYLQGQNVEIMGNSDNVLRGGLTNKPIAIGELMKHIRFEATFPNIISPVPGEPGKKYEVPGTPFNLSAIELVAGASSSWATDQPEILLLAEGEATVSTDEKSLSLIKGHPSMLITGGQRISIGTISGATIFRALSG